MWPAFYAIKISPSKMDSKISLIIYWEDASKIKKTYEMVHIIWVQLIVGHFTKKIVIIFMKPERHAILRKPKQWNALGRFCKFSKIWESQIVQWTNLWYHYSCPWCEDAKKLPFKTAKPLKLEGHLETEHQFKCDKCKVGGVMEFDKVASHLNTCRGLSF